MSELRRGEFKLTVVDSTKQFSLYGSREGGRVAFDPIGIPSWDGVRAAEDIIQIMKAYQELAKPPSV